MTPVAFLLEAKQELIDATEYYETKALGLGLDFEKEIKTSLKQIQQFPESCALRKDFSRRLLISRFPYLIIYLLFEKKIWIIAIAHCKRKPGYWRNRLIKFRSYGRHRHQSCVHAMDSGSKE